MAGGTFTLYSPALFNLGQGKFNLASDNINCILLTTNYNPITDTDTAYGDIALNEVAAGSGYNLGGLPLTGASWTQAGPISTFAAQSVAWYLATFSARWAVLVRRASISIANTDLLLCYCDLTGSGNASVSGATFQINFNNASTPSSANTVFQLVHTP